MVAFLFHLHGIAESAGCAGDDRDLLHRCAVGLHGSHKGVTDFVVGNNEFFLVCEDRVLFLITGNDDFDALLHIRLVGKLAAVADSTQRRLIDDIGKLGAGGACRHAGDLAEVNVTADLDLLCVDLEYIDAALQIGKFYRHAAVETPWPRERRIEGFGTVCRRQNDDSQVFFKTVHLGQQLVQSLFALIVAAQRASVTLFADGIDLIDEDNAGCFFLGLTEKVTDLGSAHTDEHLDKFRTGHGEERYIGLSRNRLGQHGLTGTGRADEQNALGHCGADLFVFAGIVQVFHDLHQVFFGLLFPGDIGKTNTLRGFYIDLGIALTHTEHHRRGAAVCPLDHLLVQIIAKSAENRDRQHPAEQESRHGRCLLHDITAE